LIRNNFFIGFKNVLKDLTGFNMDLNRANPVLSPSRSTIYVGRKNILNKQNIFLKKNPHDLAWSTPD